MIDPLSQQLPYATSSGVSAFESTVDRNLNNQNMGLFSRAKPLDSETQLTVKNSAIASRDSANEAIKHFNITYQPALDDANTIATSFGGIRNTSPSKVAFEDDPQRKFDLLSDVRWKMQSVNPEHVRLSNKFQRTKDKLSKNVEDLNAIIRKPVLDSKDQERVDSKVGKIGERTAIINRLGLAEGGSLNIIVHPRSTQSK